MNRKHSTNPQRVLIGFGLLWLISWSLFGSFLGLLIETSSLDQNTTILFSKQFSLLKSAHSHMNLFGMLSIIISFLFDPLKIPIKYSSIISYFFIISSCSFGGGLLFQSQNHIIIGMAFSSLGAFGFILTLLFLLLYLFLGGTHD